MSKKREPKLLPIRIFGDKVLRQVAEPVEEITEEIKEFIDDLVLTMYARDGVGLAAPQVGKAWRIFVVDAEWFDDDGIKDPKVLINPKFLEFEGEDTADEGCLSLPEIFEKVTRAEKVRIEGLNEKGETVQYYAEGLFARALQHEYDHLDGIMFIDKIPKLKRILFNKKLNELKRTTNENGENIVK